MQLYASHLLQKVTGQKLQKTRRFGWLAATLSLLALGPLALPALGAPPSGKAPLKPRFQIVDPEEFATLTPLRPSTLVWRKYKQSPKITGVITAHYDLKRPILKASFYFDYEANGGHILVFPPTEDTTLTLISTQGKKSLYRLEVILKKPTSPVWITTVSAAGKKDNHSFEVSLPGFEVILAQVKSNGPIRRWSYQFGVGLSKQGYTQTGYPAVGQVDVSAKAGITFQFIRKDLPPRYQLGLSGYATLLPLTTTPSSGYKSRYYGLNFRATSLFYPSPRWVLGISGGYYYATMGVGEFNLGYRNLMGPQLYPSAKFLLPKMGAYLGTYIKFSPIASSFSLLSLSSRELAGGLQFGKSMRGNWNWILQLDLAQLNFTPAGSTKTLSSSSQSLTFTIAK